MSHYSLSAKYYDHLYAAKDYKAEVDQLLTELGISGGSCLDLACGSGRHLEHLAAHFDCQGLDLEPDFLREAVTRVPGAALHQADMLDFDLPDRFDLITCFFGSVGYLKEVNRLNQALSNWARHLKPGGWIALEKWLNPDEFRSGKVYAVFVDKPEFKLTRMVVSRAQGTLYDSDFHYLLATPAGVEHFIERHQLRMFRDEEYCQAMAGAGLTPKFSSNQGIRGMYLARKEPPKPH